MIKGEKLLSQSDACGIKIFHSKYQKDKWREKLAGKTPISYLIRGDVIQIGSRETRKDIYLPYLTFSP